MCVCLCVHACSWLVKPDWLNKQISSHSDLGRQCGAPSLGQAPDRASVFIKWRPSVADSHWNVGVFRINEDRWLTTQRPAPRNKKTEGWTNKNPKAQQPAPIWEAEEWEMCYLCKCSFFGFASENTRLFLLSPSTHPCIHMLTLPVRLWKKIPVLSVLGQGPCGSQKTVKSKGGPKGRELQKWGTIQATGTLYSCFWLSSNIVYPNSLLFISLSVLSLFIYNPISQMLAMPWINPLFKGWGTLLNHVYPPAVFVSWVMLGMITRVMDRHAGISDLSAISWHVKKNKCNLHVWNYSKYSDSHPPHI